MSEELKQLRARILKGVSKNTPIYTKVNSDNIVHREEGEIWDENGKKWIFINGVVKKHSVVSQFSNSIPLFCPKCKKYLKSEVDIKSFKLSEMCSSCLVEFETELKISGKYAEYERNKIRANIQHDIDTLKMELSAFLEMNIDKVRYNDAGQEERIDYLDDIEIAKKNVEEKIEYLTKLLESDIY